MNKVKVIIIELFVVVLPVLALNEKCTESADCRAVEKTVCLNNVCSCEEPLWYYLSEQQKCVKRKFFLACFNCKSVNSNIVVATEFGGICFEDKQCTEFLGSDSECGNVTNTCSCSEGFR